MAISLFPRLHRQSEHPAEDLGSCEASRNQSRWSPPPGQAHLRLWNSSHRLSGQHSGHFRVVPSPSLCLSWQSMHSDSRKSDLVGYLHGCLSPQVGCVGHFCSLASYQEHHLSPHGRAPALVLAAFSSLHWRQLRARAFVTPHSLPRSRSPSVM